MQETDGPYQYMPCREATLENNLEMMKERVRRDMKRLKMRMAPTWHLWDCAKGGEGRK